MPRKIAVPAKKIYKKDILSGIICILSIRGWVGFNPDKTKRDPGKILNWYHYYDVAFWAVWQKVKQHFQDQDVRLDSNIYIDWFFGTSDSVRNILIDLMGYGYCYTTVPYDGILHFRDSQPEVRLEHLLERTGLSREFLEELTDEFVAVYNGEKEIPYDQIVPNPPR